MEAMTNPTRNWHSGDIQKVLELWYCRLLVGIFELSMESSCVG